MRLPTLVAAALGTLSALPSAAGAYIRQSQDLAPFSLFPRSSSDAGRVEVSVSADAGNTGAGAAVFFAQQGADGRATVLGDVLSPERVAEIHKYFAAFGFTGAADSTVRLPGDDGDPASLLIFSGVGTALHANSTRGAAAFGVRAATGAATKVAVVVPGDGDELAAAAADGAVSGAYFWSRYKTDAPAPVDCIVVVAACDPAKIHHDVTVAQFVNYARDLVNEPANVLYPAKFAELASDIAVPAGIAVDIWDAQRLADDGLNAILAVGQGSDNEARLVKLSYTPAHSGKRNNWKHVVLVGGGITFDSGGLSAKSTDEMATQRGDMAGAAAVLKALLAAHELKVNTRITAWLPLAENMPGGGGMRVGDIIRAYANKTVEIVTTDAESRLLMVDAIAFAMQEEHDILVDISTYSAAGDPRDFAAIGGDNGGLSCAPDLECNDEAATTRGAVKARGENADANNGGGSPYPFYSALLEGLRAARRGGDGLSKRDNDSAPKLVHINLGSLGWNPGQPYGDQPSLGTGAGVKTLLAVAEEYAI